jgi:hypothetical protein
MQPKQSMVFYRSFYEAINGLPAENRLEIYEAIFQYGLNNTMPQLSGVNASIFTLIHPQLVANQRRYENGTRAKQSKRPPEVVKEMAKTDPDPEKTPAAKFMPPTMEEVVEFFESNGYTKDAATRAFTYYSEGKWRDGHAKPVKNWKQKMRGVWFRDEHKQQAKAPQQVYTMPTNYRPTL